MELSSFPVIGIALAVVSAALLTLGNFFQSRGVAAATARHDQGLGPSGFWALARTPVWIVGSVLFGLAILAQLAALAFAPLIVVQPVGVIALVFASALTAIVTGRPPGRAEIIAIVVAVSGLAVFVSVAAAVSVQRAITDQELIVILIVLLVVLLVTFAGLVGFRKRTLAPVVYVVLGGMFAGFVATLGKTVILRVQSALAHNDFSLDDTNLLTIACLVGIGVAGALSIFFVQTAHTVNRPQTVVAGLTVIDPCVAFVMGISVLHEAVGAPLWSFAVFAVAGGAAIWAVWQLARIAPAQPDPGRG